MLLNQRVGLQERLQALAQRAGAVTVDNADLLHVGDHRVVQEARHAIDGLVHRHPDHLQFAEHALTRFQVDVHSDTGLRRSRRGLGGRRSTTDHPHVLQLGSHALAADVDLSLAAVDRHHRAFEAHAQRDPGANERGARLAGS